MLAGLLGVAIGVMSTVSIVELVVKNAMEHNAFLVLLSTTLGALVRDLMSRADDLSFQEFTLLHGDNTTRSCRKLCLSYYHHDHSSHRFVSNL
jgi:hypothetical protein